LGGGRGTLGGGTNKVLTLKSLKREENDSPAEAEGAAKKKLQMGLIEVEKLRVQ